MSCHSECSIAQFGENPHEETDLRFHLGPFDDRFVLEDLTFDGGAVSGAVRVTSDVSDVLDLEVLAGFYDADGVLVGNGRFVHHLSEDSAHAEPPEERQEFTIAVPGDVSGRAVAVSIGVPVLVNE